MSAQYDPIDPSQASLDVRIEPADDGVLAGQVTVQRSTDGGRSWTTTYHGTGGIMTLNGDVAVWTDDA